MSLSVCQAFCGWLLCLSTCSLVYGDYISRFGRDILSQTDFIVEGLQVQKIQLVGGASVIHFQIQANHLGNIATNKSISLLYKKASVFNSGEKRVVFLQSLTSPLSFRVIGEFSLKDRNAKEKLRMLKALLALELIPEQSLKRQKYLQHCLEGMRDSNAWYRTNSFREWEHLVQTQKKLLSSAVVTKLSQIYYQVPEPSLRRQLKSHIQMIRRREKNSENKKHDDQIDIGQYIQNARKQMTAETTIDQKIRALELLALFPCQQSYEIFLIAANDKQSQIRSLAVFHLGFYRTRNSAPILMQTLRSDPSLRVRKNAIMALANLQIREALPEIRKYLQIPFTKYIAQQAIGKLTPQNQ